ncbi:uncharacterized protein N7477_005391 [Penicillium maclennaniae]|uniref:uncharacterized protein n=1 Tax=Penicillium maclennaniae TaxID=1343394 RepID=UPI002541048A|nr:uncharacterized protein N7477_005391 [Penicillium maclennaniae]KAJ5670028.1 hypothetical protein N7477_005391 [Penicillium maclennaniae]
MWDDKCEEGENWEIYERYLWDYLEQASLEQPAESRIAGTLRSLTLDRTENNNQAAFLHSSCLFVNPQLLDVTIRGFMVDEADGEVAAQYERQTELQSLRVERSFIKFRALGKILLALRAFGGI